MGADMLVYFVYFKQGSDLKTTKNRMLEKVEEIPEDEVNTYYDNQGYDRLPVEDARKEFKEIIEETFGRLFYRDVTNFEFKDYIIYITGGMSWGDAPTESYNVFEKFANLPESIALLQDA